METKEVLSDDVLDGVTGGVNMVFSKEDRNVTVYMNEGSSSLYKLLSDSEKDIIRDFKIDGYKSFLAIWSILNQHKDKITKCVIDTDSFVPTYYVGDTPYTQAQIDQGILN